DVAMGAYWQTLEGYNDLVSAIAFSPGGQVLASASGNKTIRLWDPATGAHRQTLDSGYTESLAFDPTSSARLFTDFGTIDLLSESIAGEQPTTELMTSKPAVCKLDLSSDKTWIVRDNERIVWLPLEYRPTASTVRESTIVIGCKSGFVVCFKATELKSW
ncbi:hypothetical protein LZ30DRAFT_608625, partial [Colletotrichum cereale]